MVVRYYDACACMFIVENLSVQFRRLGFDVRLFTNCTVPQMHNIFQTFADYCNKQAKKIDCFICCLMSHGFAGGIYGSDGRSLYISEAESYFSSVYCPGLEAKPRVFLISACQINAGVLHLLNI